jgi:hypothetical protein
VQSTENQRPEEILKEVCEGGRCGGGEGDMGHLTDKGAKIKVTSDFFSETTLWFEFIP